MLHTAYVNIVQYFYAIGNTPATNLVQNLPPEYDAKVLLLGCGDPRNILFTAYQDQNHDKRKLDFTCCDLEPGLLARNVLLLSLLIDNPQDENQAKKCWNIFYHFLLDTASLSLLQKQAEKLVKLSSNLEAWHESEYGSVIRMVNSHTLSRVNSYWKKYAETANYTQLQAAKFKKRFKIGWKKSSPFQDNSNIVLTGSRSAGPLWIEAGQVPHVQTKHFWTNGVTVGTDTISATEVNPTFAFSSASGNEFSVHYGTDPLLGFHLASAYAKFTDTTSGKTDENLVVAEIVREAKSLFKDWSEGFIKAVGEKRMIVRFFQGDALRFSSALQGLQKEPGPGEAFSDGYSQSWSGIPLELDSPDYVKGSCIAPVQFDVIETSNLVDHLGLLNVLIPTISLLIPKATSTLYTETLLRSSDKEYAQLPSLLCGEISVMALLLGVIPTGSLTGSMALSSSEEVGSVIWSDGAGQFYTRIAWKIPMFMDDAATKSVQGGAQLRPNFDPNELAIVLMNVYLEMFSNENLAKLGQVYSKAMRFRGSQLHYTRASYAAFLGLVRSRVNTDWARTIEILYDKLLNDYTLPIGSNRIQDLLTHMHLFGVYSPPFLKESKARVDEYPTLPASNFKGLLADPHAPSLVCCVLVVPRTKLKVFTDADRKLVGSPAMHVSVFSDQLANSFTSPHMVFGRLVKSGDEGRYTIDEDPDGWAGTSDLIVSFWISTFLLIVRPPSITEVLLQLQTGPQSALYIARLGMNLTIYKAFLNDKNRVFILRERPAVNIKPQAPPPLNLPPIPAITTISGNSASNISVELSSGKGIKFKYLLRYTPNKEEFTGNSGKSGRYSTKVDVSQDTTFTLLVKIGKRPAQRIPFPLQVRDYAESIQISQVSPEILIICHPGDTIRSFDLKITNHLFPILNQNVPINWDLPYLSLDLLPKIDTSKPENTDRWLNMHSSFMFSDSERVIHQKSASASIEVKPGVKSDIKQSIHSILTGYTRNAINGYRSGKPVVFGLNSKKNGGLQYLIFVSCLRFDLSSRTIVADAAAFPIIESQLPFLTSHMPLIFNNTFLLQINVTDLELSAWKDLLPAAAERCRTWSHKPSCEYKKSGIPVSREITVPPFCSCGIGKVQPELFKNPTLAPFAPYTVRVALGTINAVPYLESTTSIMQNIWNKATNKITPGEEEQQRLRQCRTCGKSQGEGGKKLLVCSRCKEIWYCSAVCQKGDWKRHKVVCKAPAK